MKKIPLTNGKFAIVDDEDYPYLSRFNWVLTDNKVGKFNVSMHIPIPILEGKTESTYGIPMWRFIIQGKIQRKIIFRNRNPLDHRKSNLYLGTPSEYCISQPKPKWKSRKVSSKYKGVCYQPSQGRTRKWIATIQKEGKQYAKVFSTEVEAAVWYNKKADELYGDVAFKNKIEGGDEI